MCYSRTLEIMLVFTYFAPKGPKGCEYRISWNVPAKKQQNTTLGWHMMPDLAAFQAPDCAMWWITMHESCWLENIDLKNWIWSVLWVSYLDIMGHISHMQGSAVVPYPLGCDGPISIAAARCTLPLPGLVLGIWLYSVIWHDAWLGSQTLDYMIGFLGSLIVSLVSLSLCTDFLWHLETMPRRASTPTGAAFFLPLLLVRSGCWLLK